MYVASSTGLYRTDNALNSVPTWTLLESGFFYDIEFKPGTNGQTIYASGRDIFVSDDYGATWSSMNSGGYPNGVNYRIAIEVSPNDPSCLYALCAGPTYLSDLWKYDGSAWALESNIVSNWNDWAYSSSFLQNHVQSLCVSPTNASIVFLGNYYPIWKSTNNGSSGSWSNYGPDQYHADIHHVIYSPNGDLWTATDGGLWKSTDDGATWTVKNDGLGVGTCYYMECSEAESEYVMTGNQDCGSNLLNTYNNTWLHNYGGDGQRPMINNFNSQYMYASAAGGYTRSLDHGYSFSGFSSGSSSWNQFGDLNNFNPSIIYYANNSEVVRRIDDHANPTLSTNVTISNLHSAFTGMTGYTIWDVYPSNADPNYLFVSAIKGWPSSSQPQRIFYTTNANDPNPSNIVWNEIPNIQNINQTYTWLSGIATDYENPDIIYLAFGSWGTDKVYWYDIPNNNYKNITFNLGSWGLGCIILENGSNHGLYIGSGNGVWYTNDFYQQNAPGSEWKHYNINLPNAYCNDIQINYHSNTIRAATFGRGVWESHLVCPPNYDLTVS